MPGKDGGKAKPMKAPKKGPKDYDDEGKRRGLADVLLQVAECLHVSMTIYRGFSMRV
jgi:hypothetical protein